MRDDGQRLWTAQKVAVQKAKLLRNLLSRASAPGSLFAVEGPENLESAPSMRERRMSTGF
ncbi:hypothetical protein HMPREF2757_10055 [Brevibacterium sp. HMSC063G07]|nr:hypothetical protein HMPREF2757_10055 [Brevibacterium sp. HMSC063G07]